MSKIRRPKVSLPGRYVDMAMLGNGGKPNKTFIRLMCSAMDSYNRHKNDSMKKVTRELSND